ncbi:FadR/GntR family transcriptional regulator [Aeribacillus composti]|jgi:GntR family transcriptional repressor for pyruvate dehydrogenase complex|uniref:FadR/GntR family transcriptional regulator n=1 Tax=Aeribacillus composti TaxID=1868734 RepID=UPI002E1B8737|nr:FadR/GntR family transcriptional regulator [Aeribacillus composti]
MVQRLDDLMTEYYNFNKIGLPNSPKNERNMFMKSNIFNELTNTRVYEKIVDQIKQLIEEGKLKPNDRLPPERELAKILGCSRTSLREACRVLESEGIIISKPGGGRFVQKVDQSLILKYQINPIDVLEKTTVIQFLEAREALEPKIAEIACERATKEDIEKMEKALKLMEEKLKNPEEEIDADSNFHLSLAQATHNFVFISFMDTNLNLYRQVRKQTLQSQARYSESFFEHEAILEAVKQKDKANASEAMKVHLSNLRSNVLGMLPKKN